jgi:hypothetical protein
MGLIKNIGMAILIISLFVWIVYILFIFIPALQTDMSNAKVVEQGFILSFICGGFATLGAIMVKKE